MTGLPQSLHVSYTKGLIMSAKNIAFTGRIREAVMILLVTCSVPNFLGAASRGDINLDGTVSMLDAVIMSREMGRNDCLENPCKSDLNADGAVDHTDEEILRSEIKNPDFLQKTMDVPEHDKRAFRDAPDAAVRQQEPQSAYQNEVPEAVQERDEVPADSGGEGSEEVEEEITRKTRFKDNNDGTVTDPGTNLMWTQNANLPADQMLFYDAINYVESMNRGDVPNFGYTDWRLPELEELQSIMDYTTYTTRGHGVTPGHPFTNVQLQKYGDYPVGSVYFWVSETSWLFSLYCRVVGRNVGACLGYVWPVRHCN